jgi:hypothetical protein
MRMLNKYFGNILGKSDSGISLSTFPFMPCTGSAESTSMFGKIERKQFLSSVGTSNFCNLRSYFYVKIMLRLSTTEQ